MPFHPSHSSLDHSADILRDQSLATALLRPDAENQPRPVFLLRNPRFCRALLLVWGLWIEPSTSIKHWPGSLRIASFARIA